MSRDNESCSVLNCPAIRKKNTNLMFHAFPKRGEKIKVINDYGVAEIWDRKKLWEKKLQTGKNMSNLMKVCSSHFMDDDYESSGLSSKRKLRSTAVPSKNLPCGNLDLSKMRKRMKINEVRKRKAQLLQKNMSIDQITPAIATMNEEAAVEGLLLLKKLSLNPGKSVIPLRVKPKTKITCDVGVQADGPNTFMY